MEGARAMSLNFSFFGEPLITKDGEAVSLPFKKAEALLFFLAVPQVPAAFPRLEALPSSAEVPLNGNAQLPWRASLPGILAGEQPERSRKTPAPSFVQNAVPPCEKTRDFLQRSTRIRIQRPTFPLPYTTPCNILCLYHIKSIQTPIQTGIYRHIFIYIMLF